jgi:hypothetical protein
MPADPGSEASSTTYALHGVAVNSPLILGRPAADQVDPSFVLSVGSRRSIPDAPPPGERLVEFSIGQAPFYTAAADVEEIVLRLHGLCDFALDPDLRRVECRPEESADPEHLALVARGALIAFYLGLKGACVLHASAVETGDSAVVFAGTTGMGKSTLAAWACSRGALFVADDLVRLDECRPPSWVGRSPELRLRDGAVDVLAAVAPSWGGGRLSVDGRLTVVPPTSEHDTGRVAAVVVPRPSREVSRLELRQLDSVEAVVVLSAFPRLEGWRHPRVLEAHLDGLVRLCSSVPVFIANVPWGPPFRTSVIDSLLDEVTAVALGASSACTVGEVPAL